MSEPLEIIKDALASAEYRCPGGHRLDGVRGDIYDYMDEMMDEMELPADWDADRLAIEHPEDYRTLQQRQEANWVSPGKCQQSITIELEYDGEDYATYSYPVARGACVAALGMDEDEEYDRPLWQAAFERWRLAKILRAALDDVSSLEPVR